MRAQWSIGFHRWAPEPPQDGRSPWEYVERLTERDRFQSASEAAFSIYEHRVYDPYGDGYVPLFHPVRHDRRH